MINDTINVEEIKKQFDEVIRFAYKIEKPKTDNLFKKWEENKHDFFHIFGDKLIYEIPNITFDLDKETKRTRIQSFSEYIWSLGLRDLSDFIDGQEEGFYDNRVVHNYLLEIGERKIEIEKNSKLVKSFKNFIDDKKILDQLQSEASRIIQENKVEGTLCFSIHPLDYLSISENNHKWRSCHALDGEYCAGNLSYMMDNTTIVCYLKSKEDTILPHFPSTVPWNNKKWRVLLYLSNDWTMMFAGKQYPFSSESAMSIVLDNIMSNKWFESAVWGKWTDFTFKELHDEDYSIYFKNEYIALNDGFIELKELVVDKEGSKHFNDVLKSSCYKPIYSLALQDRFWGHKKTVRAKANRTRFEVGEKTFCLRCGGQEVFDSSNTVMCYDCELQYGTVENDTFGYCASCRQHIDVSSAGYYDDEPLCPRCERKLITRCHYCGDNHIKAAMKQDKNEEYYCSLCEQWCEIEL